MKLTRNVCIEASVSFFFIIVFTIEMRRFDNQRPTSQMTMICIILLPNVSAAFVTYSTTSAMVRLESEATAACILSALSDKLSAAAAACAKIVLKIIM